MSDETKPTAPTIADAKAHLLRQITSANNAFPNAARAMAEAYEALVRAEAMEREHQSLPPRRPSTIRARCFRDLDSVELKAKADGS